MRAGVAAFAVALLAVPATARAVTTEVSAVVESLNERLFCPQGFESIGGGVDPDDVSSMVLSALQPLDAFGAPDGSFSVVVRDLAGPHDAYRVGTICGNLPDLEIVKEVFDGPAGGLATGTVECPLGKFAVGGGVGHAGSASALDGSVAISAPYFPDYLFSPDLTDRDEGQHVAPRGWKGSRRSEGPATGAYVAVVCTTASNVVTVVNDGTAAAGATSLAYALCPDGTSAAGGGVEAVDLTGLRVASSAPVFPGLLLPASLFSQAEGTGEAGIGWRVAVRNDGGSAKPFKMAVVCAPEPDAPAAVAIAALLALAGRPARR